MLGTYGTADDEESILDALARRRLEAGLADAEGTVGDAPTPPIPDDAQPEEPPAPAFSLTPLPSLSPEELEAAREDDREAHNRRVFEMAAKRAIAGLTHTPKPTAQDIVSQPGDAEAKLRADYGQRVGVAKAQRDDELTMRRLALQQLAQEASGARATKETEARAARDAEAKPLKARELELRERGLAVQEGELARRSAADALKAKYRAAGKAKKDEPSKSTPDEVRFQDSVFRFTGSPDTPKEVRMVGAKSVREASARWGVAMEALDDLEKSMQGFKANPSAKTRAELRRPALAAAAAVNAAIGQGAMSDAEKNAQFDALGINLSDIATLDGLLSSDPDGLVSRILGAKKLAKRSVAAQARAYGYDLADQPGAQAASAGPAPRAAGSDIPMVGPNGEDVMVEPGKVEMFRKRGFKER